MNGVIIVDEKYHEQSWVEFCKRHNLSKSEEEIKTLTFGRRDKDTLNELFKKTLSDEESNRYSNERDQIVGELIAGKLSLPDGLIDLLDSLQRGNTPLAIATSSRKGYVNFIMDKFNLRKYFPIIVTAEDVTNGKPDPEIYLKTAEALHVNPEDCVVFEDALSGIRAAKSAGMKVIAITSTYKREELEMADKAINSLTEINPESLI